VDAAEGGGGGGVACPGGLARSGGELRQGAIGAFVGVGASAQTFACLDSRRGLGFFDGSGVCSSGSVDTLCEGRSDEVDDGSSRSSSPSPWFQSLFLQPL